MSMDAKLKSEWVKALRSGQYKQTRGNLVRGKSSYCCIGVCALVAKKSFDSLTFTHELGKELGLTTDEITDLVDLNDTQKCRFKTIADYIEANL